MNRLGLILIIVFSAQVASAYNSYTSFYSPSNLANPTSPLSVANPASPMHQAMHMSSRHRHRQKKAKCVDLNRTSNFIGAKVARCLYYSGGRACYIRYNACVPGEY